MIHVSEVSKQFGTFTALDNFNLQIPKGSIYGILGPNGAGKTTFLRILNQIIEPTSGHLFWEGAPLNRSHLSRIGYLPEERGLYKNMKVDDQIIYLAQLRGMDAKEAKTRMEEWFERLYVGDWKGKKLSALSKGMAQKIQFVSTVLHQPELLILDEPFSGFDPINANLIRDEIIRLNELGTTILFSTHRMESVEDLCSHICLINASKLILDGNKVDIKNKYRNHLFQLTTAEPLNQFHDNVHVISHEQRDGLHHYKLNLAAYGQALDFLKTLPSATNLLAFKEIIPSMDSIFISTIEANSAQEA